SASSLPPLSACAGLAGGSAAAAAGTARLKPAIKAARAFRRPIPGEIIAATLRPGRRRASPPVGGFMPADYVQIWPRRRKFPVISASGPMVGMSGQDCGDAVELLHEHDAHQLVRPGRRAEGELQVGLVGEAGGEPVRTA